MRNSLLIFAALLLTLASTQSASGAATDLSSLPQTTQDEIGRLCLPVQYREGSGAYRNCVKTEITLRSSNADSAMARLSFDDKYAVQQACAQASGQSALSYQQCTEDQISALDKEPVPAFTDLSNDEQYALQQSCFPAQSRQGAAAYRRCVNAELVLIRQYPAVDVSALALLERNTIQQRCSSNAQSAAFYRQCLAKAVGRTALDASAANASTPETQTEVSVESNGTETASVNETSAVATSPPPIEPDASPSPLSGDTDSSTTDSQRVIAKPDLVATLAQKNVTEPAALPDQVAISSDAVETSGAMGMSAEGQTDAVPFNEIKRTESTFPDTAAPLADAPPEVSTDTPFQEANAAASNPTVAGATAATNPVEQDTITGKLIQSANSAWVTLTTTFAVPMNQWILMGAVGVVFLGGLLGTLLNRRRNRIESLAVQAPVQRAASPLASRIEPTLQSRRPRTPAPPPGPVAGAQDAANDETKLHPAIKDNDETKLHSAIKDNDATLLQPAPVANTAVTQIVRKPEMHQPDTPPPEQNWQSGFGDWLGTQSVEIRSQRCIEFLIYWIAYGDDRYEPALKQRIFTARDLNEHDLIKRWVLKQDTRAFSDVVVWLRKFSNRIQLQQTMDLLMALLIVEHSVTPVQNTLFRFLADAFGLGVDELEERFEHAFGHRLPPIARVDKPAWWEKQNTTQIIRWDMRLQTGLTEREHLLARLGLSHINAEDKFKEADVIQAFRRAARRCHPDRFTTLGSRERMLAARQFAKFEEARDKLLGVSV